MKTSPGKINRVVAASVASILVSAPYAIAQDADKEKAPRKRVSAEIDRRAKHLYDKAVELMEYKQYERGLAMLSLCRRPSVVNCTW